MTIKEAIAILKSIRPPTGEQFPYRAEMTAYEMAISALEKQEGKKPIPCDLNSTWVKCPTCGDTYIDEYCGKCGQKIDWTKGE